MYTPPVTPPESSAPEAAGRTPQGGGGVEGVEGEGGEVVTRYPYGNVGMDLLLSKEKEETWKLRKEVVNPV